MSQNASNKKQQTNKKSKEDEDEAEEADVDLEETDNHTVEVDVEEEGEESSEEAAAHTAKDSNVSSASIDLEKQTNKKRKMNSDKPIEKKITPSEETEDVEIEENSTDEQSDTE